MLNTFIALCIILIISFISIYINYQLGFVQKIKNILWAIKWLFVSYKKKSYPGILSPFNAFNIALAATIGIGNITGVIFAILVGGPGAVFWIWISAFLGMIFKFSSTFICFKYRMIHMDKVFGGIMYIYKYQLKAPWLGHITAFLILFTAIYTGNFIQAGEVIEGFKLAIPDILIDNNHTLVSFFFCLSIMLVITHGIKYVSLTCSIISPFMIVFYILICSWIIISHFDQFIPALLKIFSSAFAIEAFGSGVVGYLWIIAIKEGILAGLFSSESAFGSSSFAHILAKSKNSFRQSMIAVLEVIIDTLIICNLTAFVILMTTDIQANIGGSQRPIQMMIDAFNSGFLVLFGKYSETFSSFLIGFILILFSYSTIIAWAYYGEQAVFYFFHDQPKKMNWIVQIYRFVYVIISFVGTLTQFKLNAFNNIFYYLSFLILIPHLISLMILIPKIKESNDFKIGMMKK